MCDMFTSENKFSDLYKKLHDNLNKDEDVKPDFIVVIKGDGNEVDVLECGDKLPRRFDRNH